MFVFNVFKWPLFRLAKKNSFLIFFKSDFENLNHTFILCWYSLQFIRLNFGYKVLKTHFCVYFAPKCMIMSASEDCQIFRNVFWICSKDTGSSKRNHILETIVYVYIYCKQNEGSHQFCIPNMCTETERYI